MITKDWQQSVKTACDELYYIGALHETHNFTEIENELNPKAEEIYQWIQAKIDRLSTTSKKKDKIIDHLRGQIAVTLAKTLGIVVKRG